MVFDRKASVSEGELMGVGHPLMEKALYQSERLLGSFCVIAGLDTPLLVVEISSRVTDMSIPGCRVIAGVVGRAGDFALLKDWEVIRLLNKCALRADAITPEFPTTEVAGWVESASKHVLAQLEHLRLPFSSPQAATLAVFCPN
ncbi:hypothetical protein ACU4HD_19445 [Cupriavidus basilensis]